MEQALINLKHRAGVPLRQELKLRGRVDEDSYFAFLTDINRLDGLLFAVMIDMGDHDVPSIKTHRDEQARRISANVAKMDREAGRMGLQRLAEQVAGLPPQLYVQLQCQIVLFDHIIRYGSLYYVQRHPKTLRNFRWRIDQKNETRTAYELAFSDLTPMLLQTGGLSHPLLTLEDADYKHFERFLNQGPPSYLKDAYGIQTSGKPGFNIGMICGENREFVDSKNSPGVQVADLLASGLRKCFRRQFADNHRAACLLGSLMTEREDGPRVIKKLPPPVLHLSATGGSVSQRTHRLLVGTMAPLARDLLT